MKYAYFLLLSGLILVFSCDTPPKMERVDQGDLAASEKESDAVVESIVANPEDLLKAYFSALKTRDHQELKSYLKYPQTKFFLDELTPITHWEIVEVSELTSEEADTSQLKPNPIKGDYLLKVKQYTVDDYKKTSYLVEYIIREERRVYQLINRFKHPKVQTLFLNLTRDGITEIEELEVIAERPNSYLLKAEPHFWISVNAKAEILAQLQAEKGSEFILKGNEIILGDSLHATWGSNQQFELNQISEEITEE